MTYLYFHVLINFESYVQFLILKSVDDILFELFLIWEFLLLYLLLQ